MNNQKLLKWKDKERGLKLPIHTVRTCSDLNKDNILVCIDFHDKDWQSPILGVKLQNNKTLLSVEDSINPKLKYYSKEEFNNTFEVVN